MMNANFYRNANFNLNTMFKIDRERLAAKRLTNYYAKMEKLVSEHSAEATLAFGCLAVAAVYYTAPVILALCVSPFVLLAIAYFKEPTQDELLAEIAANATHAVANVATGIGANVMDDMLRQYFPGSVNRGVAPNQGYGGF